MQIKMIPQYPKLCTALVLLLAVTTVSAVDYDCTWFSPNTAQPVGHDVFTAAETSFPGLINQPINELPFWGSHDAGCVDWGELKVPEDDFDLTIPKEADKSLYITQERSVFGQMCGGTRVFDLRVTLENTPNTRATAYDAELRKWRIHHSNGYFQHFDIIAKGIKDFFLQSDGTTCRASRKYEVVILRMKMENGEKATPTDAFFTALNNYLTTKVVYSDANDFFTDKTLADINAGGSDTNCGKVIIVSYKTKATSQNYIFKSGDNLIGKYADKKNLDDTVKDQKAKRKKFYQDWYGTTQTDPRPLFGYWMTSTNGKVATFFKIIQSGFDLKFSSKTGKIVHTKRKQREFSIHTNTQPIFNGKYKNFVSDLVTESQTTGPKNVDSEFTKGVVIWTDFAGSDEMASVGSEIRDILNTYAAAVAQANGE